MSPAATLRWISLRSAAPAHLMYTCKALSKLCSMCAVEMLLMLLNLINMKRAKLTLCQPCPDQRLPVMQDRAVLMHRQHMSKCILGRASPSES